MRARTGQRAAALVRSVVRSSLLGGGCTDWVVSPILSAVRGLGCRCRCGDDDRPFRCAAPADGRYLGKPFKATACPPLTRCGPTRPDSRNPRSGGVVEEVPRQPRPGVATPSPVAVRAGAALTCRSAARCDHLQRVVPARGGGPGEGRQVGTGFSHLVNTQASGTAIGPIVALAAGPRRSE
jgi:hypothetical protein